MPNITGETEWLVQQLSHDWSRVAPKDTPKIKLHQLISKLGFIYEKLRNAIDYNEEHLIRRASLKRLLNRQVFFLAERDPIKISRTIIFEFIRAKYLPNDTLPESDIEAVAIIIAKYLIIEKYVQANPLPEKHKISAWLVELLACEVDQYLLPAGKENAIVGYMYGEMLKSISFLKSTVDEQERNLQIYLAVNRNLIKADPALLRYLILKLYRPDWSALSPDQVKDFCSKLIETKDKIDAHINHPVGFQLTQMMKMQAVYFGVIRQLIEKETAESRAIMSDSALLEKKVTEICNTNYKKVRGRLLGSIVRVIIYIFCTKTVLAFLIEYPYDLLLVGKVNWNALYINIAFHPLLMTAVAMAIKVPGDKNTKMINEEIQKIVHGEERKLVYKPKKIMRRDSFAYIFFNSLYLIMFVTSFGFVIWVLHRLSFNIVSGLMFVFFLTLVSFFGFRLRNFANQYLVLPRKENLFNFLVDIFTLPIVRVGKFLSSNFSKVNIFIYILDFAIETPFKMLVELLEKALSFIGEKREEIS